mgnify:CR=1 FL=1
MTIQSFLPAFGSCLSNAYSLWYEISLPCFLAYSKAAAIKASVVEADQFESGQRRVLNLGHTYGHAIEWWQRTNNIEAPYNHGEAVAIGIIQAAVKSEETGKAKQGLADKLRTDFSYCGLPTQLPCPPEELEQAVAQDKKAEGNKLNFVFIKNIGNVCIDKI